jgi:hypothetical protein
LSARASNQGAATGGALVEYYVEHAVFGLDRWLRQRHDVHEYSSDPVCVFRVNRAAAAQEVMLLDGTRIHRGDPILDLHLWNEHVLPMRRGGATLAWALQMNRAVQDSLRELAHCLAQRQEFSDISAVRADMRIGTAAQAGQLARIVARYGFEAAAGHATQTPYAIHRFGESMLLFLLVLATNPPALRRDVFQRDHALFYLSRGTLDRRYGGVRPLATGRE